MNKDMIMKSDVLDILFENRNKTYGAYPLRKYYNDRVKRSLIIMMMTALLFAAFTFLPKKEAVPNWDTIVWDETQLSNALTPDIKEPPKPKADVPAKQSPSTEKFNIPIIVEKTDPSDKLPENLDNKAIGSATTNDSGGTKPPVVTPPNTGGHGDPEPPKPPVIDKTIPIPNPEIMPQFPGGMEALRKFLQRNLVNPRDMEEGEEVTVKVRFVVGLDGKLQSFLVTQDGGNEFNKEVIRVLKKMPDWIPGRSNGENVLVYCSIPVKFVTEH